MATGPITQVSDIITPEIFTPYVRQQTTLKSALLQSGAVTELPSLTAMLAGAGVTFQVPSFKPLDDDEENISGDQAADRFTGGSNDSSPKKIGTAQETAVRLSRNQSWSSADLAAALAGTDPMMAIADGVVKYWVDRLQAAFIATMSGVFADNAAAPTGTDQHTINDLTNDISDTAYSAGVTNFSRAAFLDTTLTLQDSMNDLGMIAVHPVVYNAMQKANDIDFIPDSEGKFTVPTYLGHVVVMDARMPSNTGVYESWMFAPGAVALGMSSPKVPTEVAREAAAGNGGGQEILYDRVEWAIHPHGHAYKGAPAAGGPSNAATANNLKSADSWTRVFPQRNQIKMARLITREF